MKPTTELPADPALPGIEAIRTLGLARVIPQLELEAGAGEIRLVGYTPGARATLEAHLGPGTSPSSSTRTTPHPRPSCTRPSPVRGSPATPDPACRRSSPGNTTLGSWSSAGWKDRRW